MVGAVLVRDGRVIARGYHRRYGDPHAEVEVLRQVPGDLEDTTLYVSLEPCCHQGKTGPCTERILSRRVGAVVVGTLDPNPKVAGRGIEVLRTEGVSVKAGVLEDQCRALNRNFFHWMQTGRPWVTLKWAQSLDGRIATTTGDSRWISSEISRKQAHRLRATHDALLVGVETVRKDDPQLTVRHVRGRNPIPIVLDSRLRIPADAKLLTPESPARPPWIATTDRNVGVRMQPLQEKGARVFVCPTGPSGQVDIDAMLEKIGGMNVSSLLVEGGGAVLTSFVRAGVAQRIVCFIAPIFLGKGVEALDDLGVLNVASAFRLSSWRVRRSGPDMIVDALLA
jgi:diaminohydroxyphosphoribosylaminopyrimidine deaminase/5-amino-6-(5-phosphoribosylamino)uracil reductase